MYEIYKHTNQLNNKSYIGLTKNGWENRLQGHIKNAKNGAKTHFANAIRKYGVEKFSSEIIAKCDSKIEANSIERFYISWFDSQENGYNMTPGGEGGSHLWTEEQKKRHSLNMSGNKNGMYNKHHTVDSKNLIGGFWKRNNITHPNVNRKVPQSQKDIQSIKMTGRKTNFIWISNDNVKKSIKIHKNNIYDYLIEGWRKGRKNSNRKPKMKLISKWGEVIISKNIKIACQERGISWFMLMKNQNKFIDKIHISTQKIYPNTKNWKITYI